MFHAGTDTDRQTDRQTDMTQITAVLRNFANAPTTGPTDLSCHVQYRGLYALKLWDLLSDVTILIVILY
jgi:hypothetical protein